MKQHPIYRERSKNGAWSKEVLARWGVPWPPPPGWLLKLETQYRSASAKHPQKRKREPTKKSNRRLLKKFPGMDPFLASYEWRRVRMEVLKEQGPRCACCGASPKDGVRVHVDHIKPRKTHPELRLEKSNLQVLCEVCNHGKGNWDETDWREVTA